MNVKLLALLFVFLVAASFGPPNCNIYSDSEPCYEACLEAEHAIMHSQGSRASQQHFDRSIGLCPSFAYAHYEKAVPFAKRGLMIEWKEMIDHAVEANPREYLSQRAWYHYFFMRNYRMAIRDLESLAALSDEDPGYTGDGDYHLQVMKALCLKGLGKKEEAIRTIEAQLAKEGYTPGLYDYLHLGVLYLETGQWEEAQHAFEQQHLQASLAETYYYQGQLERAKGNTSGYTEQLKQALALYDAGQCLSDPYTYHMDKVFRAQIEREWQASGQAGL